MSPSTTRRLAHGLWLATGLVLVTGVVMHTLEDAGGLVSGILIGLPVAMYATVGALVARRRPENPIGWLFCSIALSLALWVFGSAYAGFGAGAEGFGTLFAAAAIAWIGILTPITLLCEALPTFLLVFPDGALRRISRSTHELREPVPHSWSGPKCTLQQARPARRSVGAGVDRPRP